MKKSERTPDNIYLYAQSEFKGKTFLTFLELEDVRTLADAYKMGKRKLLLLRGVGQKTIDAINKVAKKYGFKKLPTYSSMDLGLSLEERIAAYLYEKYGRRRNFGKGKCHLVADLVVEEGWLTDDWQPPDEFGE